MYFNIEYCKSEEQIADLLTKAVTVQVFQKLRDVMGIENVGNMRLREGVKCKE
jgi:hypothetical protein